MRSKLAYILRKNFSFIFILFCFEKEKKILIKTKIDSLLKMKCFYFFLSNHKIKPLKRRMDSDFVSGLSTIIFSQKRIFFKLFSTPNVLKIMQRAYIGYNLHILHTNVPCHWNNTKQVFFCVLLCVYTD